VGWTILAERARLRSGAWEAVERTLTARGSKRF